MHAPSTQYRHCCPHSGSLLRLASPASSCQSDKAPEQKMVSLAEPYTLSATRPSIDQDFVLYQDFFPSMYMADPSSHEILIDTVVPTASSSPLSSDPLSASSFTFIDPCLYTEPNYLFAGRSSPTLFSLDEGDGTATSHYPSDLSTGSAASSNLSSPLSNSSSYLAQSLQLPEWGNFDLSPTIASHRQLDFFATAAADYPMPPVTIEDLTAYSTSGFDYFPSKGLPGGFVDPTLIQHQELPVLRFDTGIHPTGLTYPFSPSLPASPAPQAHQSATGHSRGVSQPPLLQQAALFQQYSPFQSAMELSSMPTSSRRMSMSTLVSPPTPTTPCAPSTGPIDGSLSGDDAKDKLKCTFPGCGRLFKDLKSHMLTHQTERPEKCPIQTCEYHVKGFARRYDKNRHTLTHYKGTMVCGFCPGSGSAAEKSFNRADVFKRHLTAVHGVEQSAPNSRKRTSSGTVISATNAVTSSVGPGTGKAGSPASGKKLAGYPSDATGKCSTCSQTFANAQDFYEHLDECVLRIVQQEDPAEAINAQLLAEVEYDADVVHTLEKNNLPVTTVAAAYDGDEDEYQNPAYQQSNTVELDDEMDMEADEVAAGSPSPMSPRKHMSMTASKKGYSLMTGPANGVQKSRGLTYSRGGVPLSRRGRGRKPRSGYPSSWGFDKGQMKMKKRVVAMFDGGRRLAKDDMLLSSDHEVRIPLADGKSYVTDLDVLTIRRADALLNATDDEKGPWMSDDPRPEDVARMRQMQEALNAPTQLDLSSDAPS